MNPSLNAFKEVFRNSLLDLLWRQWSALGVAGHAAAGDVRIIDPEALLLLTCTIGRYEPRLFDEMLDWLRKNGRFINIMRLKRILRTERFAGERALAAVAACMTKGAEVQKWKLLAESVPPLPVAEELFRSPEGKPLPVLGASEPHFARYGFKRGPLRLRGYSQKFRPTEPTNLALQLRALFGVTVRCEIVLYLLTHEAAHPAQIAREAYYFERAVQGTLVDMSRSGVVGLRSQGRKKVYWLKHEHWANVLNRLTPLPLWSTWPPLFSALEQLWIKLSDPQLDELEPLLLSSELRQLMVQVRPAIERSGFDKVLSDDRQYLGEYYLPVFCSDVLKLLT